MVVVRTWWLVVTLLAVHTAAQARSIAFTFDDGPDMKDEVYLTARQRNDAILAALRDAHVKSVLFVTRTDADPARIALLREWGSEGHRLANHTATHPDIDDAAETLPAFEADLASCDAAIRTLPGYWRRFRFPYLKGRRHRRETRWLPRVPAFDRLSAGARIDRHERLVRAFEDPVYAAEPEVLPAGESILWSLAKQRGIPGLRYPGEDDRYEKPLLDALGL